MFLSKSGQGSPVFLMSPLPLLYRARITDSMAIYIFCLVIIVLFYATLVFDEVFWWHLPLVFYFIKIFIFNISSLLLWQIFPLDFRLLCLFICPLTGISSEVQPCWFSLVIFFNKQTSFSRNFPFSMIPFTA